jgi:hypothetical protein
MLATESSFADVNISFNIKKPLPPYLSDWKYDPTIIQMTLTANTNYKNIRISFSIEDVDKNVIIAYTNDNSAYMPRFDLYTGVPLMLNGSQIVRESAITLDPSIRRGAISTQMLPEGNYEFCVKILDELGNQINMSGITCKQTFITIPDPPMLIKPIESEEISSTPTILPNFIWSSVANPPMGTIISYQLKIAPLFVGQNDRTAIDNNPPLFNKLLQPGRTSYQYLPSDLPFNKYPDAIAFVWQIQSFDQNGKIATRNDGKSEIGKFILSKTMSGDTTTGSPSGGSLGSTKDSTKTDSTSSKLADSKKDSSSSSTPSEINCGVATPLNKTISTKTYKTGDKIKVGEFEMNLTSDPIKSGDMIKGDGYITVAFLKNIRFAVEFNEGITINSTDEVISGVVKCKMVDGFPIVPEMGLNKSQIIQFLEKAAEGTQKLSSLTDLAVVKMPIGIDNVIKSAPFVLGITSVTFAPDGAIASAAFKYKIPGLGPGADLCLTGKTCLKPTGFGDNKELYLAEDFSFPNSGDGWNFVFKQKTLSDKGTFLNFDKDGFKEINIAGKVEFPRTWIIPYPDDKSSKVNLNFTANYSATKDLVAVCSIQDFTPASLEDFIIHVSDMYLDLSPASNPPAIKFPQGYLGDMTNSWSGFYISKATMKLPEQFKLGGGGAIQGVISDLLIDKSGLSADAVISNIADIKLSSFRARLDTFSVKFVQNSFKEGKLNGKLKLPISEDELKYNGTLVIDNTGKQNYNFNVNTDLPGGLNVNMWKAKFQLESTSYIKISKTPSGFKDTVLLNANISIDAKVGKLPLKFELMRVDNFLLTDEGIKGGDFKLGSPQKQMCGFDVSAGGISLVTKGLTQFGLKFEISASLYNNVFAGTTGFTIWAKKGSISFDYDDLELNKIKVSGEIIPGLVKLNGELDIYSGDATYGDGFRGNIKADIMEKITGDITVQFGSKQKTASLDKYTYWYFDASLLLATGFPVMTGVGIYGFGGGASYHMKVEKAVASVPATQTVADASKIGATCSGVVYKPDENSSLSFKAKVIFGTHPEPTPLNGSMEFLVSFNSSGGLGFIQLKGDAYLVSKITDNSKPLGKGTADMSYDFGSQCFNGHFTIQMSLAGMLTETSSLDILADKKNSKWHFYIGTWESPSVMSIVGLLNINNYFMVGNDLPGGLPPFPNDVKTIFASAGKALPAVQTTDRLQQSTGKGISLGGSTSFGGSYNFLIFYAKLAAGFGFDLNLHNYPGVSCKGSDNIGIDGWYAMGQMYAYVAASIGLHVDLWFVEGNFEILSGGFAAILQGGLPNPTWAKGTVAGYYRILKGLVKGHCSFEFNYGNICEMVSDNPLAIGLISDMQPTGKDVSVFMSPAATFNFPVPDGANDNHFDIQTIGSNGSPGPIRTFRIILDNKELYQVSPKVDEAFSESIADEGMTLVLTSKNMLKETTNYKFRIKAHGEELKGSSWQTTKYEKDGDPRKGQSIVKDTTITFTTGKSPNYVVNQNVIYAFPAKGQRSFIADKSLKTGYIAMRQLQQDIFDPNQFLDKFPEYKNKKDLLKVEYLAVFKFDGTKSKEVPLTLINKDPNSRVEFDISHLDPSKVYNLQLVARITPKSGSLNLSGITKMNEMISNRKTKTSSIIGGAKIAISGIDKNLDVLANAKNIDKTGDVKIAKTGQFNTNLNINKTQTIYSTKTTTTTSNAKSSSLSLTTYSDKNFNPIATDLQKMKLVGSLVDNGDVIDTISNRTIDVKTMQLLRANDKRIFESDFFFRTSKFKTMTEKINHFTFKSLNYLDYAAISDVKMNCSEPFEEIDLVGQKYSTSGYGSTSNASFGPFVRFTDDETTDWFKHIRADVYNVIDGNTGLGFTDGTMAKVPLPYWLNDKNDKWSHCNEGDFDWEQVSNSISDFTSQTKRAKYLKDNSLIKTLGPPRFNSLNDAVANTGTYSNISISYNSWFCASMDNLYLYLRILDQYLYYLNVRTHGVGDAGYSCLYVNCIAQSSFGNYTQADNKYYSNLNMNISDADMSWKCIEWLYFNYGMSSEFTKLYGEIRFFMNGYYPPSPDYYTQDNISNWNLKSKRKIAFFPPK